jgi:hypothetical protein
MDVDEAVLRATDMYVVATDPQYWQHVARVLAAEVERLRGLGPYQELQKWRDEAYRLRGLQENRR